MKRTLSFPITDEAAGKTAEQFLREKGYSRHILTGLKKADDGIVVDGVRIFTSYRLSPGETLTTHIPEETGSKAIVPVPMKLTIVYEDEDLLVINKPAGMPIHPSLGNYDNTLANGVAFYFAKQNLPFVFRAINRLDRDTTGLLILAKNPLSGCILSKMGKERQIHRHYLAVATGLTPDFGTIDAPIARVKDSTIEREVNRDTGEAARTHYRRLAYQNGYSLVFLTLETGRTHQIRVHMKYIGYPLPGDFLYNPDYRVISRQALHSFSLEFAHPITGECLSLYAPLPEDMTRIFGSPPAFS